MIDQLTEKLLQRAFGPLVRQGQLDVVLPWGRELRFGDGGEPQARLGLSQGSANGDHLGARAQALHHAQDGGQVFPRVD